MELDPRAYWIWLQRALGAGSGKAARIWREYPSLRDFYCAGAHEWRLMGLFSAREVEGLSSCPLEDAAQVLQSCARRGQTVTTLDMPEYPEPLRQIPNPPCVLYVQGVLPDFSSRPAVAIVGTRHASAAGRQAAFQISSGLGRAGAVVVSGGAKGIDAAAHQGALSGGGVTVCVLGCGIDYPYLLDQKPMRDAIREHGALLSEYPPETPPSKTSFPIRNRIISGLSDGVLVVEAAGKSGSLITARFAADQGRDVFAVPGGISQPGSLGVNHLIQSGAKLVTCAHDVLEEYFTRYPNTIKKLPREESCPAPAPATAGPFPAEEAPAPEPLPEGAFSPAAAAVYRALTEQPRPMDEIAAASGLPVPELFAAVTELELAGRIRQHSGRRYSL